MRNATVARDFIFDKLFPSSQGNLTADRLAPYDILVLVTPDYNYTSSEVSTIIQWVNDGGSVFMAGEPGNGPFAKMTEQINSIASSFGMSVNMDFSSGTAVVLDKASNIMTESRYSHKLEANPMFGYVNITSPSAFPVWYSDGGIVIAASEASAGRAILSADMNWFTDSVILTTDNLEYAINIFNWLSSKDAPVLLYVDDYYATNHYVAPVTQALNSLGIKFQLTSTAWGFNISRMNQTFDLAVVDAPTFSNVIDSLTQHIEGGGRAILSTWNLDAIPDHRILPLMGVKFGGTNLLDPVVYVWDSTSDVFNVPFDFGADSFTPNKLLYNDDGDTFHVLTNGTSLAGLSATPEENMSLMVLRSDGKTLVNGFLIAEMLSDEDQSGFIDSYELWVNEIAMFFPLSIDSPDDVTYDAGTSGHSIEWSVESGLVPGSYMIERNGSVVASGTWDGSSISLSIDGLDVGVYEFFITVTDYIGRTVTDTVLVTVLSSTTGTTTTDTTGAGGDTSQLLIIAAVAGVLLLIVLVLVLKRRKS